MCVCVCVLEKPGDRTYMLPRKGDSLQIGQDKPEWTVVCDTPGTARQVPQAPENMRFTKLYLSSRLHEAGHVTWTLLTEPSPSPHTKRSHWTWKSLTWGSSFSCYGIQILHVTKWMRLSQGENIKPRIFGAYKLETDWIVVDRRYSGARLPRFKSQLFHLLALDLKSTILLNSNITKPIL